MRGAVNATTLRLSSQAALLPGSRKLLFSIQKSFLGDQPNSLINRIDTAAFSNNQVVPPNYNPFINGVTKSLNNIQQRSTNNLNRYFGTTPIKTLSVDATGQRIPLQQYLGTQVINQFANTVGSLGAGLNQTATNSLFANGALTADPTALASLQQQNLSGISTAAYQLSNNLNLFSMRDPTTHQCISGSALWVRARHWDECDTRFVRITEHASHELRSVWTLGDFGV